MNVSHMMGFMDGKTGGWAIETHPWRMGRSRRLILLVKMCMVDVRKDDDGGG